MVKKVNMLTASSLLITDHFQALVLAHDAMDLYGNILNSVKGVIFMATPHRGSELVPWAILLSNFVNVASFGRGIRKSLLRNIDRDSDMLGEISRQFTHRATKLKLMSFVEQQAEPPLTALVPPKPPSLEGCYLTLADGA